MPTLPVVFQFDQASVRVIARDDGQPWFCLRDVCDVLDIQNPSDMAAKQLSPEGVDKIYTPTSSGDQAITFVNEPNLYRVIFRSNKPEAKKFQDWVFVEVLMRLRFMADAIGVGRDLRKHLLALPGAVRVQTQRFGGVNSKVVAIPLSLVGELSPCDGVF